MMPANEGEAIQQQPTAAKCCMSGVNHKSVSKTDFMAVYYVFYLNRL
jgi:hypothetical protein